MLDKYLQVNIDIEARQGVPLKQTNKGASMKSQLSFQTHRTVVIVEFMVAMICACIVAAIALGVFLGEPIDIQVVFLSMIAFVLAIIFGFDGLRRQRII